MYACRAYNGRPRLYRQQYLRPELPDRRETFGVSRSSAAQKAGVRLVINAVVDRIEADDRGRITAVSYLDPEGNRTALSARIFVIAAHGFKKPKLILMNELAKRSDQVGLNSDDPPDADDEPLRGRAALGRARQYLHGANL